MYRTLLTFQPLISWLKLEAFMNRPARFVTLDGIFVGTEVNKNAPSNKLAKLVTAPPKPYVAGFVVAIAVKYMTPAQPIEPPNVPNVVTVPPVMVTTAVKGPAPEYVCDNNVFIVESPQSTLTATPDPIMGKVTESTEPDVFSNVKDSVSGGGIYYKII